MQSTRGVFNTSCLSSWNMCLWQQECNVFQHDEAASNINRSATQCMTQHYACRRINRERSAELATAITGPQTPLSSYVGVCERSCLWTQSGHTWGHNSSNCRCSYMQQWPRNFSTLHTFCWETSKNVSRRWRRTPWTFLTAVKVQAM
jgi:hypothetical protein